MLKLNQRLDECFHNLHDMIETRITGKYNDYVFTIFI